MGRNNDNAPVGNTCSMIDEVISFIDSIDFDLTNEEEKELYRKRRDILIVIEKIRDHNSQLRGWGNDMCKNADEFEKELDYANKEIRELKSTIENLEDDYKRLESDYTQLENETNQNL